MGTPKARVVCSAIRGHPPARVPLLHVNDGGDHVLTGSLGSRLHRHLRRKQPAILPLGQRSMQAQQRGRFEDNRGTDQPARTEEDRAQTSDHAISGTEIGRPSSRPIQDQHLVLDQQGFGNWRLAPQAGFAPASDERSESERELESAWGANSRMRVGSSGWIRTSNPPVNSRMLYHRATEERWRDA